MVLWRRLDRPGHEASWLERIDGGWRLSGVAVTIDRGKPCGLRYAIACDEAWRTRTALVEGRVGEDDVRVAADVDAGGSWRLNGVVVPEIEGCIDADLNFSPSTNLLPIRRLALAIGEEAVVEAAWLRFPSFHFERLSQKYVRLGEREYRYESRGGAFVAELVVDGDGVVLEYPGFCSAERR